MDPPITTAQEERCGDSCGLVKAFVHYIPKEDRMARAVEAVSLGKMSQAAAAREFDVPQQTISWHLARANGSAPATNLGSPAQTSSHLDPDKLARLEALYCEHVGNDGKMPRGKGRDWLAEQTGLTPKQVRTWLEKQTKTTTSTTTTTTTTATTDGTLEAATAEPEAGTTASDPTEHFNAEQLRDHCAAEVANSDRPDDYKRAVQLLAELDHIITAAWRRQHPEPWIAGDWSHISGELQALHSIAHQRAVELSEAIVQRYTAVTVTSSAVP